MVPRVRDALSYSSAHVDGASTASALPRPMIRFAAADSDLVMAAWREAASLPRGPGNPRGRSISS
jgi:hypothetical protein